jgi:TonB family protein
MAVFEGPRSMKPKPLISEHPGKPQDTQFAHFGILNDGAQSKASTITSLVLNTLIAFVLIIIGAAAKKTIDKKDRLTELTEPIPIKKTEPVKPKVVPPQPKLPEVPKIVAEAPKIIAPQMKLPDVPKPVDIKMDQPKPVLLTPPAPKAIPEQAAPKVVNLAHPSAPALVNNSPHPSAVALGNPTSPIPPSAVARPTDINLGNKGVAGMPSSNTGMGRPTTVNLAGSGSPGGVNHGAQAIQGIRLGVAEGTGPANAHAGQVNLGQATPPPMPKPAGPTSTAQRTAPKVIFKPKPEYTAEAIQAHVEGVVTLHIKVLTNGTVEVVGVTNGLGHGLDESAKRAILATKFQPATDASGQPIEWDGIVNVAFQLAG